LSRQPRQKRIEGDYYSVNKPNRTFISVSFIDKNHASIYNKNMNIKTLTSIGLSEKSAKIYLATLSLGVSSVQKIAERANVKRATAYLYIQELINDGFLQKVPSGKKEYYTASNPELLKNRFMDNFQIFQSGYQELQNLYSGFEGKLKVRVLEGENGLKEVYKQVCNASQIRFIADLSSVESNFQESFSKISLAVKDNEIITREIIPNTDEAKHSSKRYAVTAGKYYSSRIATNGPIHNDCAIFDNTLALFRLNEFNLFVVLIEEPTIAQTMKTVFDLAWLSATPFIGK